MTREEIMNLDIEQLETRRIEMISELEKAETNEAMDLIQDEMNAIEERKTQLKIEIEEKKKDVEQVANGAGTPIMSRKEETEMEVRDTREYIEAYADYIKTGNDMECRKLTSTNDTTPNGTGSVPVPTFVYDIVKTAWEREGIMSLVRKTYLKGNLKVGFEISADGAVIHNEGAAAVDEENLVLGVVELVPKSIKKWISISDEVYDLRGEAFLRYIYDELTYRIAKKAADELVAKIVACGTVSTTTCPAVPKITTTTISIGLIANALGKLSDEAGNPTIIMNKGTWAEFKAAQYAANYPIDPFEGLRVVFNNTLNTFAVASTGDTVVIVGDLDHGAMANFPNGEGIDFKFDDMSRKKEDLIEVLGRQYVGLGVVAPDAFVKICK